MWWAILLAAPLLVLLWAALDEEYPVDKLPGPPRWPIIGSTLEFFNLSTVEMFKKARYFAKTYGDRYVIKIFKRRIVLTYKVEDIEVVLSHSKNISKSKPYSFLKAWLGSGLLISTGSKWFHRRKILTPTFHFNILKNFSKVMEEKSRDLVERLRKTQGSDVDLMTVISDFTLYTICETAMGTQLDVDKSSAAVGYKKAILDIGHIIMGRLTKVYLHNEFMFMNSPMGRRFQKCLKQVHSFAHSVISERRKNIVDIETAETEGYGSKKRLAMLDLLLAAERRGEIDLEGIQEEVDTFMFEGHDTTATALTYCFMLLADHEDIQDRIYEECRSVLGDREEPATMSELSELKYLEAVIKETLRLYPSVPYIARTITHEFSLDGYVVKPGNEVGIHIYDLHRREDLYPDPDEFRPDRFLGGETRHPYAYIPFSAGLRNCIGQRFAMQEMKIVLSEVCRAFRMSPREHNARPTLVADMVLRPVENIYVKFIPR